MVHLKMVGRVGTLEINGKTNHISWEMRLLQNGLWLVVVMTNGKSF